MNMLEFSEQFETVHVGNIYVSDNQIHFFWLGLL